MKLKPFKELIAMSKEAVDAALAPVRARQVRSKADLESAKLDEKMMTLELQIQEECTNKTIDFDKIIRLMDEYGMAERRKKQFSKICDELFPD